MKFKYDRLRMEWDKDLENFRISDNNKNKNNVPSACGPFWLQKGRGMEKGMRYFHESTGMGLETL